jgi:hypothetical protein
MTVSDIYTVYRIMPNLQLHQLRVAAVAQYIAERIEGASARDIVLAGLFHDMGNIIKSDFSVFPEFLEPEGREYWQGVKDDFIARYGTRSHEANVAIAREAGVPDTVIALIDGMSFGHMEAIYTSGSLDLQIIEYGDMRVGPYGIVPLKDRFDDSEVRYQHRYPSPEDARAAYQDIFSWAARIETRLCEMAYTTPDDLNDATLESRIAALRDFQIG